MFNLRNDYCTICHPKILDALNNHRHLNYVGYGLDSESKLAQDLIKTEIGLPNADVHFLVGGTITNKVLIHHALKSYEAVICCDSGHINVHETGAIEQASHKVLTCPHHYGKIKASDIREVVRTHTDEHMVKPKMVYISNSTEYGTIYRKEELEEISKVCKELNLYLYLDGARLACGLMSRYSNLTLKDIANLVDAFYIGGTKNGLMLGEALVIINDDLKNEFRYTIKQLGGMYSKGFVNGIQFKTLFTDNLFYEIGLYQNSLAYKLSSELEKMGVEFEMTCQTNQLFPIFNNQVIDELSKFVMFEYWSKGLEKSTIRFVTHYMLTHDDINQLISKIREVLNSH